MLLQLPFWNPSGEAPAEMKARMVKRQNAYAG